MKYFSTFSGIGGFDLALDEAGHKCIGYSEIKQSAISVYENKFPNIKNYGDIKRIKTLPNFDILVGGTPCQDFTILGKREGLQGSESSLFYEFVKILKKKKPSYFIFENVKGSMSSNGGKDFAIMQIELSNCGYDIQWQVLNSKNFGLAQNRQRVYIVGCIRGKSWKGFFPIRTSSESSIRRIKEINGGFHRYRTYSVKGIAPTLTAYQKAGYARVKIQSGKRTIRELTPIEYERLQGFPDNWTDVGLNKYERYELIGNAVSVNVVKAIINKLK